jgi:hypothetical protein
VSAEVDRLRTQHADAVREKSASDSKCRKLTDRVAALEKEKADLRRQLAAERICRTLRRLDVLSPAAPLGDFCADLSHARVASA